MSYALFCALVGAVALERVGELVVARRHLAWSLARGGRESGFAHYPFMVFLHTGLLAGCLLEAGLGHRSFQAAVGLPMLALVLASQALRWWCIVTLGPSWNTRVVIVPGSARVTSGPYRHLRHPNYLAVVVEGAALPLVHDAWITAMLFTVLNAALLRVRLRVENRALAELGAARA